MKTSKIVIVLLALLALIPCTQSMAQTAPTHGVAPAAASVNTAEFLATLSSPANTPGTAALPPAPTFLSTLCNTTADCPQGQLCCYPCGIDGCHNVCTTPLRGHCPLYP
ncbi:MAG TPA: hypothetical protein VGH73_11575 [Thermoanaerobaculia bacterium]|jgi:hypothetical protein